MTEALASDDVFLDEVFELAFEHRTTGKPVDVDAIVSRRPHLRSRILRVFDLAGDVTASSPLPAAGHRFGNYRIVREIGRGGQATVYLAEDTRLGRHVALKILDPAPVGSKDSIRRFVREAEITSKLDHPGICTVYESGESSGSFWIAMRYIEGTSLANRITAAKSRRSTATLDGAPKARADRRGAVRPGSGESSGPTTPTEIAQLLMIFEKVARALHAAHEHGVIHRDIKPGNIMIGTDDEPVILDFGLAHELEGAAVALTLTGAVIGTPSYMSREQVSGEGQKPDPRTDVYSLAVSLYESLTLERPFEAPTREGLFQAILTKDPSDVRRANPAVGSDLKVVLETAMEKDRDRRYQTALSFAEDLRRVRVHEPILARPVGPFGRLERWVRRNPALGVAVGGFFVVLTAGLAIALFLLAARDEALGEKIGALSERSAALSDYDRLGDLARLQRLQAEAATLWPCEPSKGPAMRAWIDQAIELHRRLPGHQQTLERLRASPTLLPYTAEDREADLKARGADDADIATMRRQRDQIAAAMGERSRQPTYSLPEPATLRVWLATLDADIARREGASERLGWRFRSSAEQFKHDTIQKLVAQLTAFIDPDPKTGLLADVRARLEFIETTGRETERKHADKWAEAIRSIADVKESPKYGGLRIKPIFGLIPLGKNPESGLWEFSHLQTAAPGVDPVPARDRDGRIVVTAPMGFVFVLLPGGTFRMGAVKPDDDQALTEPNVDRLARDDEHPVSDVTLEPFFVSKYEMTQAQWVRLTGKNPSRFVGTTTAGCHPVEEVKRDDCEALIARLGFLLPTEAQWEYAARGGTSTPVWTGVSNESLAKAANLADASLRTQGGALREYAPWDDGHAQHAPVGSFLPNPFGLHDVLGNVGEWVRDCCSGYDVTPRPGDGLRSPYFSRYRIARGGNFMETASARSAYRYHAPATESSMTIGVRPVMPCVRD